MSLASRRGYLRLVLAGGALSMPRSASADPPATATTTPATATATASTPGTASAPPRRPLPGAPTQRSPWQPALPGTAGRLSTLVDPPTPRAGTDPVRVAAATTGYVQNLQREAFPGHVAGGPEYYRALGPEILRVWHPPRTQAASVGETAVNNLFEPPATAMAAARWSLGPLASARGVAAGESLDHAHPNSPTLRPANTGSSIAEATARTTRAEIEIDQDAHGGFLAARVVRPSGETSFDLRALGAAREAAAAQAQATMPGGWRSRWAFEVIDSRDPIVVAGPQLAGAPSVLQPIWFESTDDGEIHHPLRVHQRRRVRLISSRRLDGRR